MVEQYDSNNYEGEVNDMPIMPSYGSAEQDITNIVGQIDPKTIIDNLDHALKGEHWDKEKSDWLANDSKKSIVNDACRGAIVSYLDGILTNNTTMSNVDKNQLSYLMESVIETIVKMFVVNLEEFGFVPPSPGFKNGDYENKGTPDTATMTLVSNMIYKVCLLVFSRALSGQESIRIFKSLNMNDAMGYGGMEQHKQGGWASKLFRR